MPIFENLFKISRQFCTKSAYRNVQVCILGADTPTGQALSFLLKQNPTISGLHIQGTSKVESMAIDFSHFDTRCKVWPYFDLNSITSSVKSADIIVMLGLDTGTTHLSLTKLVMAEGARVIKLAEACARYAPKAIVIVAVSPISVTLPMVGEVYKETDWYHPGKLLGSAALAQLKADSIAGHYQNLDPQIIHVPIIGGPDLDCAIPLFGQTIPVGISDKDSDELCEEFKREIRESNVSHAVGLNRMITEIARGLNGDYNANIIAFVRTNIIATCSYLVCPIKISISGMVHNYGLQKLRHSDLLHLEEICHELRNREEMASDFVHREDKSALPQFMVKEIEREKSEKLGIIR